MTAFFDTNVIRYLGQGLSGQHLPQSLKEKIVLPAVSAIELISQIAVAPQEALTAIHTFENWLDTTHAVLLDWSEIFVANHVFGFAHNDRVFDLLTQVLTTCYRTNAPNPRLIDDAQRLRDFNEAAKRQKAQLFQEAATALRARVLSRAQLCGTLPTVILEGLKTKYGQQVAVPIPDAQIEATLNAYIEFHADLVGRAVGQEEFNFFSRDHLNDLFDAEQLAYLSDDHLHFYTADTGYRTVRNSPQRNRIHIVDVDDVRDPARALGFLTAALA
jgi:hypothetical protein